MNSPAQKTGTVAPETPILTPETRQESIVLTGNYAGLVEAVLLDYAIDEKLDFVEDRLKIAKELLRSDQSHNEGMTALHQANLAIIELEKIPLTEHEKARLGKLSHLMVEMGIAFAAGTLPSKIAEMECPR